MFSFGPTKANKKRPDWIIIVNHNECSCLKLVAQKLSPKIRSFLKTNPDAKNIEITIGECVVQRDLISSLFFGKEIQFSRSNIDLLLKLSTALDISELYHGLLNYQAYINNIENTINASPEISELLRIENLIFLLSTSNFENILQKTLKLISPQNEDVFARTFLSYCVARYNKIEILIEFLVLLNQKQNEMQNKQNLSNNNTVKKFCDLVLKEFFKEINQSGSQRYDEYRSILQELCFIIYQLIEKNLLDQNEILKNKNVTLPLYFAHLMTPDQIQRAQRVNSFNNEDKYPAFAQIVKSTDPKQWIPVHRYNAHIGMNTTPINYAIRFDRIDDLMKYIKSPQFKNDGKVMSCMYERCSFVNEKPKFVEYAAFFGSVECFKYFISNGDDKVSGIFRYAICSGNPDIIKICSDLKSTLLGTLSLSIEYHHQVISEWLVDVKNQICDQISIQNCFRFCSFEMFIYMLKKGVNANYFLLEATHYDNLLAVLFLLQIKGINVNLQDSRKGLAPLHYACQNRNLNIVRLLVNMNSIQINCRTIPNNIFLILEFNFVFLYNSNFNLLIKEKVELHHFILHVKMMILKLLNYFCK
ncbi:hypothetical protein M9Y10_041416 [Tritrichomonas musculus]|uniref:DUF3447 domain-containing protein n=1 Tax=Tritrichomonas musculus TaxID=1915356 RepID=A0ABR2K4W0_9EUKA